jgi:hypothetical protein
MKIEIIKQILPEKTNLIIINNLIKSNYWYIASDKENGNNVENIFNNKIHSGFSLKSFPCEQNEYQKINLNIYGFIIVDIVCSKLNIKNYNINRLLWNYYLKGNQGEKHTDFDRNDFISILYNLHTTDGGIEIEDIFYKDIMAEAKVFKSNLIHQGIGPNEDVARFNLNAIVQI